MPCYVDFLLLILGVLAGLLIAAVINTIRIGLIKPRKDLCPGFDVTESELAHYAEGYRRWYRYPPFPTLMI